MTDPKKHPEKADFVNVKDWVFDLDNTLYPHSIDLFSQIDRNMTAYVAALLSMEPEEARKLQKDYYRDHGTTLQGLMINHGVNPDDFLEKAHSIDYSVVKPDRALGSAIAALPGRKFIFTNGSTAHAQKTAEALGILDQFDDIFDIVASEYTPKPSAEAYERFLKRSGVDTAHAAMFEDLPRNLETPNRLGMKTILVVPENLDYGLAQAFERIGEHTAHIDYVTEHLSDFVQSIISGFIDD
ncbi:pyrimidine 5'-nucleotidase [Martelella mediterranea]|uniref:Putative hydrolase of the HAD superfamily n=1 Tax=Martelella mediterranea TaxID=293089 RepID=A0A4R3NX73_9HYPH|nr:pyrimidine 5'-nucleotidase [Martelella mediterranea]TCT43066.1 putative hydrolase of the HAD superfamily [Martelella mediterranea]